MIEIIKRSEGHKSERIAMEKGKPQISYNSDGHLVIRVQHDREHDTLIVLDEMASETMLQFVRVLTHDKPLRNKPFW